MERLPRLSLPFVSHASSPLRFAFILHLHLPEIPSVHAPPFQSISWASRLSERHRRLGGKSDSVWYLGYGSVRFLRFNKVDWLAGRPDRVRQTTQCNAASSNAPIYPYPINVDTRSPSLGPNCGEYNA
ncbi:hypothetical protein LX32DRAFT_654046 [Colletotrichum zoysiae]|uniref:Uncharacterized protein n=1 Tax=Colletotrichum zoysiae TaxID=1216348 RepID=A0AAD9M3D4_9PEZI|nr:hypothetical protein LX32DRAFT_654046 [Colletotrichum zoysiae]